MRCIKCGCECNAPLCEEHFFEEFERRTGLTSKWVMNEDNEWVQVYDGDMDIKEMNKIAEDIADDNYEWNTM